MRDPIRDCEKACSKNKSSCSVPRAEFFFNQAAQFQSDKRSHQFPCGGEASAKNFIAGHRFVKHIPDNELGVFKVAWWNHVAVLGFTRRYMQRFKNVERVGD